MQPKLYTPAYALARTCLMYAHDSRSPHETWPHLQPGDPRHQQIAMPSMSSQHAVRLACFRSSTPQQELSGNIPSRSASVRYERHAVISLGQPCFVTLTAPFPFLDLRRQPLVPVLRQVPEHPAALLHWPSPLAHATIGEEPFGTVNMVSLSRRASSAPAASRNSHDEKAA